MMLVRKSQIAMLPVEWRERRRLRRRFARIEKTLRARDCSHLSRELQAKRARTLDNLHAYAKRGVFPRNFEFPNQHRPVFIDPGGRTCAVAQLMIDSGAAGQAAMISNHANFAYIREMSFPELDGWVNESGLSRDEVKWVQPDYPCYADQIEPAKALIESLNTQIFIWTVTLGYSLIANFLLASFNRTARFMSIITIILAFTVLGNLTQRRNQTINNLQMFERTISNGWCNMTD